MTIRIVIAAAWIAMTSIAARAQETAASLAQGLQEQFLSAPGMSLSFDIAERGRITILADLHSEQIKMTSSQMEIVSDGKTIWNYDKSANRETVDNVTASSAFKDPASLFRFADNYTATIQRQSGTHYTLVLTPNAALESLFASAGAMQTITLVLKKSKSHIAIQSATAASSKGTETVSHLTISTLKSVPPSAFKIKLPANAKVSDLRE